MSHAGPLPRLGILAEDLDKLAIWNKGIPISGWDPAIWRYDCDGRVIRYSDYGSQTEYRMAEGPR